ncbi:MAG: zinc transporter ZntB [Acetobacterales bacterium]
MAAAGQAVEDLVCACRFDGQGGAEALDWAGIARSWPGGDAGVLWIHLNRDGPRTRQWLRSESGLDPLICDALLADTTRPRCTRIGDGLLLNLRGVNLNPGADPEDMVTIRMWAEAGRIVSVRLRNVMAINDIRERLESGRGPASAADFVVDLTTRLVERMDPVIGGLDDQVDEMEEVVAAGAQPGLRAKLTDLRRTAITLRRYVAPQREATNRLLMEEVDWIDPRNRSRLREAADRVIRYIEDLDAARERAAVVQEELSARIAEQMNRNTYVLSIVAGIFLPLGLLTGLLGINVGGMPGTDWGWAFAVVCVLLAALTGLEVWLFRRLKWI